MRVLADEELLVISGGTSLGIGPIYPPNPAPVPAPAPAPSPGTDDNDDILGMIGKAAIQGAVLAIAITFS